MKISQWTFLLFNKITSKFRLHYCDLLLDLDLNFCWNSYLVICISNCIGNGQILNICIVLFLWPQSFIENEKDINLIYPFTLLCSRFNNTNTIKGWIKRFILPENVFDFMRKPIEQLNRYYCHLIANGKITYVRFIIVYTYINV